MGKALYRSYRAHKLDEVIGQDHITRTLKTSLKNKNYSHAYLLTGPRGVGKTSIARILAHEINQLSYDSEQQPIDIIEIDAASNRRIDEIRDIKEKSLIAPVQAKYKVYIIDEVHMLTKESFNALLKTLEEPPSHVVFILATTELHKLPETIISRCIHFPFKPISEEDIVSHLKSIAKSEKIDIDDTALQLIAAHGQGSFRDSISLLDQIRSFNAKISAGEVQQALGLAPQDQINKIFGFINKSDVKSLIEILDSLREFGADPAVVSKQIMTRLRESLTDTNLLLDNSLTIELMRHLLDVSSSSNPAKELELFLIGAAFKTSGDQSEPENPKKDIQPAPKSKTPNEKPAKKPEQNNNPVRSNNSTEVWGQALEQLKQTNNTLYAVARMASCYEDNNDLVLGFKFSFHKKQISQPKNLSTLKKIVSDISEGNYSVRIGDFASQDSKQNTQNEEQSSSAHKNISNIFGGSEVLES